MLDALATLERFMVDGMPDEQRFVATIRPLVSALGAKYPDVRLHAYGEMVDILWAEGRPEAAIRLEEFWNRLAGRLPFALLCAYRMDNFRADRDGRQFEHVCTAHSHVAPSEAVVVDGADALRRQIARMQQRILTLEDALWSIGDTQVLFADPPQPVTAAASGLSKAAPRGDASALRILIHERNAPRMSDLIDAAPGELCGGVQVLAAHSEGEVFGALATHGFDLCLSVVGDHADEHEALGLLRAARLRKRMTPFVGVASAFAAEDFGERLMLAGFEDFLPPGRIDPAQLRRIARNARRRAVRLQRLVEFSAVNELTGVLNRRGFMERLELELQRCELLHMPLSVIYFDLNDFKLINDRHGHAAGDDTIRLFVALIQRLPRQSDLIGRIGGDEFVAACPGVDRAASELIVRRLHQRLRHSPGAQRQQRVLADGQRRHPRHGSRRAHSLRGAAGTG